MDTKTTEGICIQCGTVGASCCESAQSRLAVASDLARLCKRQEEVINKLRAQLEKRDK